MATTVVNSTFTATVTDSISLNGKGYGNTNTVTVSSCNEAYERILHIPAASELQCFIPILSATTAPDSGGDVTFSEFEYARFTNLDSEYPIWIKFTNTNGICSTTAGSTQTFCIKLDPGMSYITPSSSYMASNADITCTDILAGTGVPDYFTAHAISHTTTCDLEMFVVTK
jgi:hypothetical protein|tara:strand:- start:145 stop:657 length:513 start_codon:yes stop_codon:yes gene_type:complete